MDRLDAPSEVFLGLWYYRAKAGDLDMASFCLCAETWHRLRSGEDEEETGRREENGPPRKIPPAGEMSAERTKGGRTSAPTGEPDEPSAPAKENGPPEASAPTGEQGEAGAPVSKLDHAPEIPDDGEAEPKAALTPLGKKKRRILGELEQRREHKVGLQAIVDAGRGKVTMEMLLAALEGRVLPVATWDDIDKALKSAKTRSAKEAAK